MSLERKFEELKEKTTEEKKINDMKVAIYDLEKELRDCTLRLEMHQGELEKLDVEVIVLTSEVQILSEQEKIVVEQIRGAHKKMSTQEGILEAARKCRGELVNAYVKEVKNYVGLFEICAGGEAASCVDMECMEIEGEIEACKLYAEYQLRKIEELDLIKEKLSGFSL